MSEYISDRELGSIEEPSMAAYAGLTITDGGVCLQRTELPQSVTVAGALSNESDEIPADVAAEIDALPKGLVDLNKEYIAARDELIAKTGKEPNSAEVFSYLVEQAKSGKNQSETTVVGNETITNRYLNTVAIESYFDIDSSYSKYGSKGYVAGITGLEWNSFSYDSATYRAFIYQTNPSLHGDNSVVDAEKYSFSVKPNDANMCWAGADANILYRTGWLTSDTKTEDQLFDLYRNAFYRGNSYGSSTFCEKVR